MSSFYLPNERNKDPKVIGPGVWWMLHTLAINNCNTIEEKVAFVNIINTISYKFPCENCRKHLQDFIKIDPPEAWAVSTDKNLFQWTWKAHNNANRNKNVPDFPYEEALRLYTINSDCKNTACTKQETEAKKNNTINYVSRPIY